MRSETDNTENSYKAIDRLLTTDIFRIFQVGLSKVSRPTKHIIGHNGKVCTGQMTQPKCQSTEGRYGPKD